MDRRVAVAVCLEGGAVFLGRHGGALVASATVAAFLWVLLYQLGGQQNGYTGVAALVAVLYGLYWFRGAQAALPVEPPVRRTDRGLLSRALTWALVTLRSLTVSALIIAVLTIPTVALAYARLASLDANTPEAATQAVQWALPVAAAIGSPLLIRLYLYYLALASGRQDLGLADVWQWGRGNSLRVLLLLAAPLVPALWLKNALWDLDQGWGLAAATFHYMGALVFFMALALAAAGMARALAAMSEPALVIRRR
jgi:hypothetical protein